jgi:hypothetical protein
MLVPRPVCGGSPAASLGPDPLSVTELPVGTLSVVFDEDFAFLSALEAMLQGVDPSSVTISPRLTASLDTAPPELACTLIESARRSPIIDAVTHSLLPKTKWSPGSPAEAPLHCYLEAHFMNGENMRRRRNARTTSWDLAVIEAEAGTWHAQSGLQAILLIASRRPARRR